MFRWANQNSTVGGPGVVSAGADSAVRVEVPADRNVCRRVNRRDGRVVPRLTTVSQRVGVARQDSDESNADIESETLSVHEHADVQEELPHESDSVELGSVISGADEEVDEVEVEEVEDVAATRFAPAVVREAFRSLDDVNLGHEFSRKAFVIGASEVPSATRCAWHSFEVMQ